MSKMGNKKWGAEMRATCEAKGLKLREVAEKAGVGYGTLKQLENGTRNCSPNLYEMLCKAVPAIKSIPEAPIGRARRGRHGGATVKTKRLVKKVPAGRRLAPKKKVKSAPSVKLPMVLMKEIVGLHIGDKKAFSRVKGCSCQRW